MAKQMLAELCEGQAVRTPALVKSRKLLPFKNKPGQFLALTVTDRSGSLEAKAFNNAEELAARATEGTVVLLAGRCEAYNGALSLVLDGVEAWTEPVDPADFVPAYTGDVAALEAQLDALIASLTEPDVAALVRAIFADPDIRRKYTQAPAAKGMHGAYLHGLLEHVTRQAALADTACRCYPQARRDLVIAGVLLHDIGKINEFSWTLGIDYTDLGRLEGHCVNGDRIVEHYARELQIDQHTALLLRHLILSHHGQAEFGAPVVPQTLEAVILHAVDNLEAKATHCIEMLATGDPTRPWSDYDRIEGRYWYRGPVRDEV
jgi:3'-5' exoribonuclease